MPLTIKLSDERMKALGITTAEEAVALLDSSAETAGKLKDAEKLADESNVTMTAFDERLAAIEKRTTLAWREDGGKHFLANGKAEFNLTDHISEVAAATAGRETLKAISKVGGAALTNKETPADVSDTPGAIAKTPEEKWKTDEKIQATFPTHESYAAYLRAVEQGRVKINTRK